MPRQDPRLLEQAAFCSGKFGGNAPTTFGAPSTIGRTYESPVSLDEPVVTVHASPTVAFWLANLGGSSVVPIFRIGCGDTRHSQLRSFNSSKRTCPEMRSQRLQSRPFQTRHATSWPI